MKYGFCIIFSDVIIISSTFLNIGSCQDNTTLAFSPGHTVFWLLPHLIQAEPCPFLYSVARLDTRQARRDSAMPLLRELHWLPIRHRVSYTIAELTFKALHVDLSPTYLQQCVQVYTPASARSLRSASSYTLVQNKSHTVAGDCTFVHAAATVWNALPVSVTSKDSLLSFKEFQALKTHFCALAYM